MTEQLEFQKRAKVRTIDGLATFRRWQSTDGRYVVVECKSHLELPIRYLAIRRSIHGESIISRHQKRERAFLSCRQNYWSKNE